ncbi:MULTISPECIES: metal-dependent hydrolase [Legionella]|uniref:Metal-dependent hydrolase n=1 Tax=Legionella resiliens TaxID=2905958 RepID=A0ABS8XBT0_9GAMM|nr:MULTISPECIES: metal-dependent hydrolase [unclassified Legionella]MCE0724382.1 metal-dependent hydrolase [Legionella sp. 9fVS26]MCE3533534.1 metal-dependent hydrolase [Legionella sp. 8cVS16]QLZ69722.1 metal-dependent hydrolase [Legionella sp. PC1000]
MDPVTHAVLGAACSQAILYKHDKHNAWLVGGLAAMAPDLDIFIRASENPMLFFLYHRHFTHSLLFIPIGALIVTLALLIFKRFRTNWKLTFCAALIGYATHGLLDACTTYGTVLLWPFSDARISWDIISIIDPFFTVPLCLGVVSTLVFNKRQPVIIALILASSFMLFNIAQHNRASAAVHDELAKLQLNVYKVGVFPKFLSSTLWRGVALANNRLYVIDASAPLFKKSSSQLLRSFPHFSSQELPDYIKESPSLLRDFIIFNWFTDNYLIFVNKKPLMLADGRFLINAEATIALWGIQFLPNRPHVNELNSIHLENYKFNKGHEFPTSNY